MASTLLKNGTLIDLDPVIIEKADLRVVNGRIAQRGKGLRRRQDEAVVDVDGRIILPGWVCAHTHLYSTLTRGMPMPLPAPRNFLQILKKIWWRIDWAHDEETVYYSALVGAIEAALAGTTLLIDHHSSPSFIKGSLKTIKQAIEEVGLRAVLCYEVTDRGGKAERDAGLEENVNFISACKDHSHFRGLFGAHASFTLSNDSLRACCRLASGLNAGIHIHAAEDPYDVDDAREKYSQTVLERIDTFGGLNSKTLLAHGTHLGAADVDRFQKAKSWVAHNPRSNMNNAVGYATPTRFGTRVALGTDGITSNMPDEARFAFFKWRDSGYPVSEIERIAPTEPEKLAFRSVEESPDAGNETKQGRTVDPLKDAVAPLDIVQILANGNRLASEIFDTSLGSLKAGSFADLIVLNYPSPTPLTAENFTGHLIFGFDQTHVESVMVGGKFVVKNRRISHLNIPQIYEKASVMALRLWDKAF